MALLPRIAKLALATAILVGLTSLPVPPTSRDPGSALAPSIAWAGGSPDETLNPKKGPSSRSLTTRTSISKTWNENREMSLQKLSLLERGELLTRIFQIFVVRF
jgi:hypothetical protein